MEDGDDDGMQMNLVVTPANEVRQKTFIERKREVQREKRQNPKHIARNEEGDGHVTYGTQGTFGIDGTNRTYGAHVTHGTNPESIKWGAPSTTAGPRSEKARRWNGKNDKQDIKETAMESKPQHFGGAKGFHCVTRYDPNSPSSQPPAMCEKSTRYGRSPAWRAKEESNKEADDKPVEQETGNTGTESEAGNEECGNGIRHTEVESKSMETKSRTALMGMSVLERKRAKRDWWSERGEEEGSGGGRASGTTRFNGEHDRQGAVHDDDPLKSKVNMRKMLPEDIAAQVFAATKFSELGLAPRLVEHLEGALGFSVPTHVQKVAIPLLLSGRDVLVNAETGTGKTLVYLLPIIHGLQEYSTRVSRNDGTFALILAPTRELCLQIYSVAKQVAAQRYHWLVPGYLIGGELKKKEKARLRRGMTILAATPGRLLDHLRNTSSFKFDQLRWLVFDEADRLLDLGFEKTILEITSLIKQQQTGREDNAQSERMPRQNVLLSATLNQQLERLAAVSLREDAIAIGFDGKLQTAVIGDITKAFGKGEKTTVGNIEQRSEADMAKAKLAASRDKPELVKAQAAERGMGDVQRGNELSAAAGSQQGRQGEDTRNYHIPKELKQMYIEVPTRLRLVALLAFLRHMTLREERCKMVVFFSTCSSVEYHYALIHSFRLLPQSVEKGEKDAKEKQQEEEGEEFIPCSIYKLHGNMNQKDRAQSFLDFSNTKEGVLLCTDVAARGLDFPCLDSIVQYDPPGEASDYVHRVGRTARLGQRGESVLFLMGCELEYLKMLDRHNVTLSHLRVIDVFKKIPFSVQRSKHKRGNYGGGHKAAADPETHEGALWIQNKLEGTVASKAKLQQLAVDAFTSFVRAYAIQKGTLNQIFHVKNLHLGHIAKSFALKAQPHTVGTIFHRKELKRKHEEKAMLKRKKQKLRPGRMLE